MNIQLRKVFLQNQKFETFEKVDLEKLRQRTSSILSGGYALKNDNKTLKH